MRDGTRAEGKVEMMVASTADRMVASTADRMALSSVALRAELTVQ